MNNTPLVSFCLITYNQERFILDALQGAFNQTYANLEILISDDCSRDNTFQLINEAVAQYNGPHKIVVNQNSHNLGIAAHINKVLYEIAKGEIIMLAAGDDVSLPTRTQVSVDFLMQHPEVSSVSVSSEECDENLQPKENTFRKLMTPGRDSIVTLEDYVYFRNFILFPGDSRVLRREVISAFPPLKYVSAEDIYLFIRSLLVGSAGYIRQPLVKYRIYGGNVTCQRQTNQEILTQKREGAKRQMEEDIEVALCNHYIEAEDVPLIEKKITDLLDHMYPLPIIQKRHSLIYRILRKCAKIILRE